MLQLQKILPRAERLAILGIGSELHCDDAAGVRAAELLMRRFAGREDFLRCYIGATAPENLTGEIKRFGPDHLIIIDAADFGGEPGNLHIIDIDRIDGISFSTHRITLKLLIRYLTESIQCGVTIIGIQPRCIDFGDLISAEVSSAIDLVCDEIAGLLTSA